LSIHLFRFMHLECPDLQPLLNVRGPIFGFSMEVEPADARPASSASGPVDTAPTDRHVGAEASARPSIGQHGELKPRAKCSSDACAPICDDVTTDFLSTDTGRACQSLAHHITLVGRCLKSAGRWAPLCVGLQSRSTSTQTAERHRTACWRLEGGGGNTTPADCGQSRHRAECGPRASDKTSLQEQAPHPTPSAHPSGAEKLPPPSAHGHFFEYSEDRP